MKRRSATGGITRQVRLPAEPPQILTRVLTTAQLPEAYAELFALFDVDKGQPSADRQLWLALAKCIFPPLAAPVLCLPQRGRPRASARKAPGAALAEMAIAYDAFAATEQAKAYKRSPARRYKLFRNTHARFQLLLLKKPEDKNSWVDLKTFEKKLAVGRSAKGLNEFERPAGYYRMSKVAQVIFDALDYAGYDERRARLRGGLWSINVTGLKLKDELLGLSAKNADFQRKIDEIEAKARNIVPASIRVGLAAFEPFHQLDDPAK